MNGRPAGNLGLSGHHMHLITNNAPVLPTAHRFVCGGQGLVELFSAAASVLLDPFVGPQLDVIVQVGDSS